MVVNTSHKHPRVARGAGRFESDASILLDTQSPVPLYTQLRELLRQRILDGTYESHEQMPSENELVVRFAVSRITVRQALNDLQREGLIFRIHGKGTFVSRPKAIQSLARLEGLGEALSTSGFDISSHVLGHRVVRADAQVAEGLGISYRDEVMEIRRVRCINREPMSLDVTYFPVTIGRRVIKADLQRRDIFAILETDLGISLGNAELQLSAMLADAELAEILGLSSGAAVLRIQRLTHAAGGAPIDFEYLYHRGDSFQYRINLERTGTTKRGRL
jgi:GntR family transcriptional regulator